MDLGPHPDKLPAMGTSRGGRFWVDETRAYIARLPAIARGCSPAALRRYGSPVRGVCSRRTPHRGQADVDRDPRPAIRVSRSGPQRS